MAGFDAAWRRRALAGDEEAAARLAEAFLGPLYRFVAPRVGRRRDLAEEVVQETLVSAYRALDAYDPGRTEDDPWPWLTGLARNEVKRVLVHERQPSGDPWERFDAEVARACAALGAAPLPEETLAREETRALVDTALAQLAPQHREALEEKYLLGRSVRAMADAWRTTEKAVESRLVRAREAFRVTFEALAHVGLDAHGRTEGR